jgi:hypothetical protein
MSRENNIEYCLRQAAYVNPYREIILLGDEANVCFGSFISWRNLADYMDGWSLFAEVYRHRSPNNVKLEMLCFLRWFVLKNCMRLHHLNAAFYSDSDNLFYADISPYEKVFRHVDMAIGQYPEREDDFHYVVSPNFTYITLGCIKLLCGFFVQLYKHDLKYIYAVSEAQKKAGGVPSISDMSAIGKFVKERRKTLKMANSFEEIDGSLVDDNVNSQRGPNGQRFALRDGIKDIVFQDGRPVCLDLEENRRHVFNALHFQGKAKKQIPAYYTGPAFEPVAKTPC